LPSILSYPSPFFQPSFSLPGSPFVATKRKAKPSGPHNELQPLVPPYLEIALPYADASNAVTPCSDDLYNADNLKQFLTAIQRRSSVASIGRRSGMDYRPSSRRSSCSYASLISRASRGSRRSQNSPKTASKIEALLSKAKGHRLLPVVVDKNKSLNVSLLRTLLLALGCRDNHRCVLILSLSLYVIVHWMFFVFHEKER